ncbi:YgdI/YgdR family lipoprotein [Pseudomonas mangiferae]|uniref:YgdI/YgdR family lipoprotein n=1 Tax=Pseudomonas mangiferae TaxID=2593654 RepID=A0A553GZB8_9PSED|nr:YgdI/YgdR family lipoprotein [Pseudomonas mangiferae]TRX74842.1 YgdI/YgdR family lipoprotein [Pseudomonas mangiferae]
MTHRFLAALSLALGTAVLAGCSTPSIVTLNDGREIQTVDEPRFDEKTGFYQFEQFDGRRARVNKDQVQSIREL